VTPSTWEHLEAEFRRFPILKGQPASAEEVEKTASVLGLPFPDDYRDFLLRYGAAIVGPYPIFGLRPVEPMGNDWSVVEINRRLREDRWPGIDEWLIISQDHAGNPMGFASDGQVWISDHGHLSVIAKDFEAFILGSLKLSGAEAP